MKRTPFPRIVALPVAARRDDRGARCSSPRPPAPSSASGSSTTTSTSRSTTTARSRSSRRSTTTSAPTPRHGILRDIPTRLRYDDTYDRIYPLDVVERACEPTGRRPTTRSSRRQAASPGSGSATPTSRSPAGTPTSSTYTVEAALNALPRSRRALLERDRHGVVGADRAGDRPRARARRHHAGGVLPGLRGLDPAVSALGVRRCAGAVRAERARSRTAGSRSWSACRRARCPSRCRCSRNAGASAARSRATPATLGGTGRGRPRRDRLASARSSGVEDATGGTAARRWTR